MYRKLCFLSSFVLVFALSGAVQAVELDVNNHSFEWMADGNQVTCHTGLGDSPDTGVLGWTAGWLDAPQINAGWSGVDVNCGVPGMCPTTGDGCKDWIVHHDGNAHCYVDNGNWIYQVLDHNIVAGMRYDLVFDGLTWEDASHDIIRAHFYYQPDGNQDANQIDIAFQDFTVVCTERPSGRTDWVYDLKLTFVAQPGQAYLDELLGIKIASPSTGDWMWVERVRVYSQWASQAYDPSPADGALDVPKDADLSWSPGLWAKDVNGHDVYFGSTFSEVDNATTASAEFQGVQSPNSFDPTPGANVLTLGEIYYWRIDEVNENYTPGPVPAPPNGRWKGEVWSFEVEGKAKNPKPFDGSTDVPRNVILRWTRGVESLYHDVYFGSTDAEVASATTGSGEYKTRLNKGTEEYDAGTNENPTVAEQYFWRIDEVNSITVKGNIWDFTIADYILVDDFDFYANATALRVVWKDYYSGHAGEGTVWVNKDANYAVDGNSMILEYWNDNKDVKFSETQRSYSSAQDWSYAGGKVTELEIDWFGDMNNVPDPPMYVKLSDGSATVQVNPGPNDVTEEWVHTWHIALKDFNDGGVTLSSITSISLGIGPGIKGGGASTDSFGTVYFDDIRLYPPRCYPDKTLSGDFTGDCVADVCDLRLVVADWCRSGGWFQAQMPATAPIVEYLFENGSGTAVANTGSYGSSHDLIIGKGVDANHTVITDPNNDPCWFNDSDPCRGWTLWFDGNSGHPQTNYEGDTGDYLLGMTPLNLNTNTVTIATWLKPDPWLINAKKSLYEQKGGFTGMLHSREQPGADTHTFGLSYNFTGGYTYNGEIGYEWYGDGSTWGYHSGIMIPDWRWSLAAVVIQPEAGIVYLADFNNVSDPNDDVLFVGTHTHTQVVDDLDGIYAIAADGGIIDGGWEDRFFRGQLDAVRVYDYSLTPGEILGLAEMKGIVYLPLNSDADLCVGNKSPTDPCAPIDDQIDFCDWSRFADEWLEEQLWPPAP